ncbi:cold shock domain-containing protein E1 [Trichonephila clavipes]|nr:cold shock domain-containing protein E1 [Trichonephila clavipes]
MDEDLAEYEFGITSLDDKHEFLQKGDVVQFQIGVTKDGKERAVNIKAIRTRIQATRTGKYSACSVVKIGESQPMQRPERLNRLRTISSEGGGPRLILIRQPKGPDGSTGFKLLRSVQKGVMEHSLNPIQDLINETCSVTNELRINEMEPNPIVCSQG